MFCLTGPMLPVLAGAEGAGAGRPVTPAGLVAAGLVTAAAGLVTAGLPAGAFGRGAATTGLLAAGAILEGSAGLFLVPAAAACPGAPPFSLG